MTTIKVRGKSYEINLVGFKIKNKVEHTFTSIRNNYIGKDKMAKKSKSTRISSNKQKVLFLNTKQKVKITHRGDYTTVNEGKRFSILRNLQG